MLGSGLLRSKGGSSVVLLLRTLFSRKASSRRSGKTALLERLARDGQAQGAMAALVGDLATDLDARRLQDAGLPSVQLNTGQACHLNAAMVARGLETLEASGIALTQLRWLWIEKVGNLVCLAAYDQGEDRRLVLLAVGKGEDKPLKYPAMFRGADLLVITKLDLAEAVGSTVASHGRTSPGLPPPPPWSRPPPAAVPDWPSCWRSADDAADQRLGADARSRRAAAGAALPWGGRASASGPA